VLPEYEDFYTGDSEADTDAFERRQYEIAKTLVRVDSSLMLDTSQAETLSPGANTGTGVTFTAGGNVFAATDVGRIIVKKHVTGYEYGIAEITGYTNPTTVTCDILQDFDSIDTVAAGDWFLSVTEISGLEHLEGETVTILSDGAVHPERFVSAGSITLDAPATVVIVGLGYRGWIKTMPLESRSISGSSMAMTSTVNKVGVLFRHTLGAEFGTDPYNMEQLIFRNSNDRTNQPPPLYSGMEEVLIPDGYGLQKFINVIQNMPLPCTVQAIIPFANVTEEP
jgi:hypothetical protein